MRVICLSGVKEVTSSADIQVNSIYWFRAHIKKADILAANDVQFKTKTMEVKAELRNLFLS